VKEDIAFGDFGYVIGNILVALIVAEWEREREKKEIVVFDDE